MKGFRACGSGTCFLRAGPYYRKMVSTILLAGAHFLNAPRARVTTIRPKQRGLGSLVIFFSEFAPNIGPELFHHQSQSVVADLRAPDARRVT